MQKKKLMEIYMRISEDIPLILLTYSYFLFSFSTFRRRKKIKMNNYLHSNVVFFCLMTFRLTIFYLLFVYFLLISFYHECFLHFYFFSNVLYFCFAVFLTTFIYLPIFIYIYLSIFIVSFEQLDSSSFSHLIFAFNIQ